MYILRYPNRLPDMAPDAGSPAVSRYDVAVELVGEYGAPVFPCNPDKSPRTLNGFKDATTDLDMVDQWFKADDALIGVSTGDRFFVVDIDPAGMDWYAANGGRLDCSCINTTRRGRHLIYEMPNGVEIRCSAGKIAPGVDVRGTGGYVIWWPGEGLHTTGTLNDIGPAPDWLLQALTEKPKGNGQDHSAGHLQHDVGQVLREGQRNSRLTSLAGKLRRDGLDAEAMAAALLVHNASHCVPPLPDNEVRGIATSVGRYLPGAAGDPGLATSSLQPLSLRTALECAETLPKSEWLLRPYLERNATTILYGDYGTYKTFLALDWAFRIAIGLPAIGSGYIRASEPVVFISAEGRGMGKRIRAWFQHEYPDQHWRERLPGVPLHIIERPVNLSDTSQAQALVAAVESLGIKPALIVIDTLSRNSNGEIEASTSEASAYLAVLDQHLRTHFCCAILLTHHVGHVEKQRIRGPIALAANTDALIRIDRTDPVTRTINLTVERLKDSDPPAPVSLRAVVVDLGELDEDRQPLNSLAFENNGDPVIVKKQPNGKNQQKLLAGLREWQRAHPGMDLISSIELKDVAKAQGLNLKRIGEVTEGLERLGHLVPAAGGHRLDAL
jgi:hypothetical protein